MRPIAYFTDSNNELTKHVCKLREHVYIFLMHTENHVQFYLNNRKLLSNSIDFNMHNIQFSQATMATVTIMHIVVCNSKSDITLDKPIPLCYFVVSRINSTSEIAFK